ncbi:MAG: class I SAM-dependent methyltransferase [Candidatus Magasanikbacteria bacterium]|nr:class I SAM-dependent methyltransferase [Candidatus Magasanikbacteria bacterium]
MNVEAYGVLYKVEKEHWWTRVRARLLRLLVKRYFIHSGNLKILDVGCGTGLNSKLLESFGTVYSLDVSEEALRFCSEQRLKNLYRGEANSLPFGDGNFDLVIALDVFEHLKDDQGATQEIKRVLKPGGIFICFVPAFSFLWSAHDEYLMHQRRYDKKSLEALFVSGWTKNKVSYFNFFLFPPIVFMRFIIKLFKLKDKDSFERLSTLNAVFYAIFKAELPLLRLIDFPFGVSLLAVYQKNTEVV